MPKLEKLHSHLIEVQMVKGKKIENDATAKKTL